MAVTAPPLLAVRDSPLGRRLATFMLLGFLALIGAGIAAAWVVAENQRHARWVAHTYQVENVILDTRRLLEQGETARRGFLLSRPAAAGKALRPAVAVRLVKARGRV